MRKSEPLEVHGGAGGVEAAEEALNRAHVCSDDAGSLKSL